MNRSLSCGDRDHRSPDPGRPSRFAILVPGADGLSDAFRDDAFAVLLLIECQCKRIDRRLGILLCQVCHACRIHAARKEHTHRHVAHEVCAHAFLEDVCQL